MHSSRIIMHIRHYITDHLLRLWIFHIFPSEIRHGHCSKTDKILQSKPKTPAVLNLLIKTNIHRHSLSIKLPLSNDSGNFRSSRTARSNDSRPVLFSFFPHAVFFLSSVRSPDSRSSFLFSSICCARQVQTISQSQQGLHNPTVSFSCFLHLSMRIFSGNLIF